MTSVAKVQKRNAYRYYTRGVAVGDGVRPARKPMKDAQEEAGLPPGVWMGRGLPALRLTAGETVTDRQAELLFGRGPAGWRTRSRRPGGRPAGSAAKASALVVARFRHFDNRHGFPLLHDHCLILNRVQRLDDKGKLVRGALGTVRLYQHVVAAGTLYTLTMTTQVCEELGLATVGSTTQCAISAQDAHGMRKSAIRCAMVAVRSCLD